MRRRHRGSALFYEVEMSGKVTAGQQMTSTGFATGSTGWAIDGDGNVEFNSGNFRGDLTGANGAFDGTVSAANITAGNLASDVINTGNLNADNINAGTITSIAMNNGTGTFQVDAAGNLTATAATITGAITATSGSFTGAITATSGSFTGTVSAATFTGIHTATGTTFNNGTFANITATNITADGTIRTTSSGKRIEFGNQGNDQISFYDGVSTYPGSIEVNTESIDFTIPNNSVVSPMFQLFEFSTWSRAELNGDLQIEMSNASSVCQIYQNLSGSASATANLNFQVTNSTTTGGYSLRHVLNGSTSRFGFYDDGTLALQIDTGGIELISGSVLRLGVGNASFGNHPTYEGLFHKDLSNGVIIMSNGTDTYIGSDDEIYFRDGSTNIAKFNTSNELELYNYPQVGTTAYPGTSGNDGSYYYSMALDYGGSYGGIEWTRSPDGTVTVIGLVKANSSTIVNGNAFLLAPTWARTGTQRVLTGISNAGGTETAQRYDFLTNGQLVYKGSSTIANGQFLAVHFSFHSNV